MPGISLARQHPGRSSCLPNFGRIKIMKTWIFRFTAKQLRAVHSDHLGFILASSHCCNELTSVSPYLIFEHELEEANEVEKAFILIRFFTLVRFQIAKIFEY